MNYALNAKTASRVYSAPECISAEISNGEMICATSKPESGSLNGYTPEEFAW